jgi:hypothetical protein
VKWMLTNIWFALRVILDATKSAAAWVKSDRRKNAHGVGEFKSVERHIVKLCVAVKGYENAV